jgi:hypothetical protein
MADAAPGGARGRAADRLDDEAETWAGSAHARAQVRPQRTHTRT